MRGEGRGTHQSIMMRVGSLALVRAAEVAAMCSAEKLGPLLDPRRMTWQEGFPSVSTTERQTISILINRGVR